MTSDINPKSVRRKCSVAAWTNNKRALTRWLQKDRLTAGKLKQSLTEAHFRCECCGCTDFSQLTIDHVIPLKHGGRNHISNVQWLCAACNKKKGTNDTDYRVSNREYGIPHLLRMQQRSN